MKGQGHDLKITKMFVEGRFSYLMWFFVFCFLILRECYVLLPAGEPKKKRQFTRAQNNQRTPENPTSDHELDVNLLNCVFNCISCARSTL